MAIKSDARVILPIEDMQIGDSFFIACVECSKEARQIVKEGLRYGLDLKCLSVFENNTQGIRVFRLR